MGVVLRALLVLALAFVRLLGLRHIVQIRHDLTASMQLGRTVLRLLDLADLILLVTDFLFNHIVVLILVHGKRDELFSNTANFLGAGFGRDDLAVPNECGREVSEHCNTLIGGPREFPVCHCCFLLNLRSCAG